MANFIQGDGLTFDALIYGGGNRSAQNLISNMSAQFNNRVHQDFLPMFQNLAGTVFEAVNVSKGLENLKALGYKLGGMLNPHQVSLLENVLEMQQANEGMRRWIMACPDIRSLYHNGMISGYDGLYQDIQPDAIGEDHYDYRRATCGIIMDRPDGKMESWQFFDDGPVEDELVFSDQVDIICTWNNMKAVLDLGIDDPTSAHGGKL